MTKLVLAILLVSFNVLGADLNLSGGESATIQANVSTRVTCGGTSTGSGDCSAAVAGFESIMSACETGYTALHCIDQNWPSFKANNPNCLYAGIPDCLKACETGYTALFCANKCQ